MRRALAMSSISALALLTAAAGGPGCGSGSAADPDGGAGASGGSIGAGGHAGGGAGGSASTSGTINCGDPYAPVDPTAVIDDMETPDFMAVRAAGRDGSWWAGGDTMSPGASITPSGDADAESIPVGRCGSTYAMHVTGQGYTVFAVLSVSM